MCACFYVFLCVSFHIFACVTVSVAAAVSVHISNCVCVCVCVKGYPVQPCTREMGEMVCNPEMVCNLRQPLLASPHKQALSLTHTHTHTPLLRLQSQTWYAWLCLCGTVTHVFVSVWACMCLRVCGGERDTDCMDESIYMRECVWQRQSVCVCERHCVWDRSLRACSSAERHRFA